MRVVGIDLGRARIGLAVGLADARIATPRPPLSATGALARDAQALDSFARAEQAEYLILGEPKPGSRPHALLAEHLRAKGWLVDLVDETLTSHDGELTMSQAGLKASERRRRSDGEAACRILERWFEARS